MRPEADLAIVFPHSRQTVVQVVSSLRSNVNVVSVKDAPAQYSSPKQLVEQATILFSIPNRQLPALLDGNIQMPAAVQT